MCYLLCVLQLFFVTHLEWAVEVIEFWTNEETATLAFILAKTLIKMRDSPSAFVPEDVFQALQPKFPKFKQQDPQEVHQYMCCVITDEEKDRPLHLHPTSPFLSHIQHSVKKIYKCLSCGTEGKGHVEDGISLQLNWDEKETDVDVLLELLDAEHEQCGFKCPRQIGNRVQPCEGNSKLMKQKREIQEKRTQNRTDNGGQGNPQTKKKSVPLSDIHYDNKEADDQVLLKPDSSVEYNLIRPEKHLLLHLVRFDTGLRKKVVPVDFHDVTTVTHYQISMAGRSEMHPKLPKCLITRSLFVIVAVKDL